MEKREQKNVITEARGLTSREYFPKLIILEISSFSSLEQNSYLKNTPITGKNPTHASRRISI